MGRVAQGVREEEGENPGNSVPRQRVLERRSRGPVREAPPPILRVSIGSTSSLLDGDPHGVERFAPRSRILDREICECQRVVSLTGQESPREQVNHLCDEPDAERAAQEKSSRHGHGSTPSNDRIRGGQSLGPVPGGPSQGAPGGPGATGEIGGLNCFFLLLDRPEVYNLPVAPMLPPRRTGTGLFRGIVTMAGLGLAAAAVYLFDRRNGAR